MTAAEITAVVTELAPALKGAWIQKIRQPSPLSVTLEVRTRSRQVGEGRRSLTVLLCLEPELARLHIVTRPLPSPAAPPPYCQFLRAHIQGGQIEGIEQMHTDRIVRMPLTTSHGTRTLIAEFVGRAADLLLLNEHGHVMGTLRRGSEPRVGQPYAAPLLRPRPGSEVTTATPPRAGSSLDRPIRFPISAALEEEYAIKEQASALERQRTDRQAVLRQQIKKVRRHIEGLQGDLEKAERYRNHARYGDLLKANLGTIVKGQREVTVVDYFDSAMPSLVIPLDPARSAQGNMEDYFRKYRKYLTAEQQVRPRMTALERQLEGLQEELAHVLQGTWQPPAAPSPTPRAAMATGAARIRRATAGTQSSAASGPFRRFTSTDGLPVYVGRNAKENEGLTFGLAHSDDLWFHAHGVPGSHVVVRLERGMEAPLETIKDAATLALLYSDLKKSGRGEVIYTKRKYVRKLRGQPPGTVSVTQERAIFVQLDRLRLQRLKDSRAR